MNLNLTIAVKTLNNKINIVSFSFLLAASLCLTQNGMAASGTKNDSAAFANSKIENISVAFSSVSGKAILEWKNNDSTTSHFVIERSGDNVHFMEAAVIFAPEDGSLNVNKFRYSDKITVTSKKFIYYRLKFVDVKGASKYSKTIKLEVDKVQSELI